MRPRSAMSRSTNFARAPSRCRCSNRRIEEGPPPRRAAGLAGSHARHEPRQVGLERPQRQALMALPQCVVAFGRSLLSLEAPLVAFAQSDLALARRLVAHQGAELALEEALVAYAQSDLALARRLVAHEAPDVALEDRSYHSKRYSWHWKSKSWHWKSAQLSQQGHAPGATTM